MSTVKEHRRKNKPVRRYVRREARGITSWGERNLKRTVNGTVDWGERTADWSKRRGRHTKTWADRNL